MLYPPTITNTIYLSSGAHIVIDGQALHTTINGLVQQVNLLTAELTDLKERSVPFMNWVKDTHPELVQQFIAATFVADKLEASRQYTVK